jgi:hypothetical protein
MLKLQNIRDYPRRSGHTQVAKFRKRTTEIVGNHENMLTGYHKLKKKCCVASKFT